MPFRSEGTTLCTVDAGSFGMSMSASSIFRVLAGASFQCALCSARTSPVSASVTIHERAVMPFGSAGTPAAAFTCVPGRLSRSPPTFDITAGGLGVFGLAGAACAVPASTVPPSRRAVRDAADAFRAEVTVLATRRTYRARPPSRAPGPRARHVTLRTLAARNPRTPPVIPPGSPPILVRMKLSRRVSWFLVAFGVWSWIVWTTFVKNLWKDTSGLAFHHGDHSHPTAYFWIHLALAITSTILGTAIGVLGIRGLRALRRERDRAAGEQPQDLREQQSERAAAR